MPSTSSPTPSAPLPTPRLIQQAVRVVKTGEFFRSGHQHDYVQIKGLPRGLSLAIDGGTAYRREVGDFNEVRAKGLIEDYHLYSTDPFPTICEKFLWGTRGPSGTAPFRHVLIKDCTLDHLKAIRDTQFQIRGSIAERVVLHWIKVKEDHLLDGISKAVTESRARMNTKTPQQRVALEKRARAQVARPVSGNLQ